MQFPPLPLANFSIHSLEQRFGVFFVVAVLQNGRQIMAGPCFQASNPCSSVIGRNAIYIIRTSVRAGALDALTSGVFSGCCGIKENFIFCLFTFGLRFWREPSSAVSPQSSTRGKLLSLLQRDRTRRAIPQTGEGPRGLLVKNLDQSHSVSCRFLSIRYESTDLQ